MALAESRQDKDSQHVLFALMNLSYGYVAEGRLDEAEAVDQKALKVAQDSGQNQWAEMFTLMQEGLRAKMKPK